ncbi:hypothetical protein EVAR_33863_1 [Eumeta japonica]|uniref:Uncharacterized protein n=1 Tax=Eumeta variegata TaxID=151549 RepID=A0A4C1X5S8_EUMVA|nr:hypothetical protein EVAR_33863_1 [Eumeta japonica]
MAHFALITYNLPPSDPPFSFWPLLSPSNILWRIYIPTRKAIIALVTPPKSRVYMGSDDYLYSDLDLPLMRLTFLQSLQFRLWANDLNRPTLPQHRLDAANYEARCELFVSTQVENSLVYLLVLRIEFVTFWRG